jgi:hypothetical protein
MNAKTVRRAFWRFINRHPAPDIPKAFAEFLARAVSDRRISRSAASRISL